MNFDNFDFSLDWVLYWSVTYKPKKWRCSCRQKKLKNLLQFDHHFDKSVYYLSYISEQTGDKIQNAIRNRFSQLGKSICKINVIITNMHIQAFMTVRHDKSKGRIQGILAKDRNVKRNWIIKDMCEILCLSYDVNWRQMSNCGLFVPSLKGLHSLHIHTFHCWRSWLIRS